MADLKQLGKYKVVEVIGKGAMGIVYKGYDPVLERSVALKTVRKELVDEKLAVQIIARFKNEALASGRLNHPAIVSIYDYGENKQLAYIAMEYVQGRGLRDFLARQERFGLQDVMSIMSRLLDALHYAHEHGVVHRDIKPQNIIMTPDGRLKVADFGIARIDRSNLTQVGSIMGTPAYMSPEQYAGQQVDRRSDVFSCGVVLYELLTGVKPFEGPTETVGYKICHEPHRNPSEINPQGVPGVFDAILAKALAKKAEDRYASAREFAEALAKGFESRGGESAPTEVTLLPTIIHQDRRDTTFPPLGWAAEPLRELEELLAPYVGPMARVLVRRSAKTTTDGPTLVRLLAESVRSERDAKAFAATALEKVFAIAQSEAAPDQSSPDLSNRPIDPGEVDKAAGRLAPYVGPIARVMAKKAVAQARDLKAFYQRLAENLADPEERAEFLKNSGYGE
ncbi:MAG TPA: serine/threonine-protein kinase [Burkholderiales bacterium]|nr:serine/threonine-protein kinase [Burkholderiales bacterium]